MALASSPLITWALISSHLILLPLYHGSKMVKIHVDWHVSDLQSPAGSSKMPVRLTAYGVGLYVGVDGEHWKPEVTEYRDYTFGCAVQMHPLLSWRTNSSIYPLFGVLTLTVNIVPSSGACVVGLSSVSASFCEELRACL
jgi:hypothetical protein